MLFDIIMIWYHCLQNDGTSGHLGRDAYHPLLRKCKYGGILFITFSPHKNQVP